MPTYTTNYRFQKPTYAESADVEIFNQSFDKIDDVLKGFDDTISSHKGSIEQSLSDAQAAASSANSASQAAVRSQTNAQTAATTATGAQTAAEAARTAAETAKDKAQTALTSAQTALTNAQTAATNAEGSAQKALNALGYRPYVGENGNWYLYNADSMEYEDSGYPAQGPEGPRGPKGETGSIEDLPFYEGDPEPLSATGSVGTSDRVARGDHSHPVDTEITERSTNAVSSGAVFAALGWVEQALNQI